MNSFDEESLRKLSYSELKKQAKENGIKINMTADKIIASLLEKSNADEDSFVTLERTILNSCKKNKIALFDRESKRMSETPRRDTYTVDTPTQMQAVNTSIVMASASPELKQSKDESLNVTLSRGSEKKNRKSKRKVSFVTPLRRSTRLSIATPQYNSVKGRPKTPMPSRSSSSKKRLSVTKEGNDTIVCNLNLDISDHLDSEKTSVEKAKRPSTPLPVSKQKKRLSSSRKMSDPRKYKQCFNSSPKVLLRRLKEEDVKDFLTKSTTATPIPKANGKVTKADTPCATDIKIEVTPVQSSKNVSVLSSENKAEVTPMRSGKVATSLSGFKKIVTPFPTSGKSKSISSATRSQKKMPGLSSSKSHALTPGFKKAVTPFSSSVKATTPTTKSQKKMPRLSSSKSNALTPGFRKVATPFSSSVKAATPRNQMTPRVTPSAVRKSPRSNVKSAATPKLTASAVKKTPNFNKLHQKAFDKMESLSDYRQRKLLNSQKKKEEQDRCLNVAKSNVLKQKKALLDKKSMKETKTFSGIPFIPSAANTKPKQMKLNQKSRLVTKTVSSQQIKKGTDKSLTKKALAGSLKAVKSVSRENGPLKQRHKFDLKASLARKLSYKPHAGPLKPLNEINLNNTIAKTSMIAAQKEETKNVVLAKARAQTREVLHGVRKNKRFMLQMNNRNLNMSVQ